MNILVKALTAAPFPDFSLCISLLGEAPVKTLSSNDAAMSTGAAGIITEPIIVHLATLSTFLFETKFRDFWALYNSGDFADVRKYTANAAGFEDDVRMVVLNSVKGTFRTISEARIGGYLNLQGADLAKFINEQPGWELSNGTVTVPANIDNEVKPTVTREEISLESMYGFLTHRPVQAPGTGTIVIVKILRGEISQCLFTGIRRRAPCAEARKAHIHTKRRQERAERLGRRCGY